MRPFSRNILEYIPDEETLHQKIVSFLAIGITISLLITWIYYYTVLALTILSLLFLWVIYWSPKENKRLARTAESRKGETICEFARSFDRKEIDPWIIRAVWQELQDYLKGKEYGEFPIRESDHIEEFYRIDSEDINDIGIRIAKRIGRDLTSKSKNPYFDKVNTVGDLVLFMNHQPLTNN